MGIYNFFKHNVLKRKDWAWHEENIQSLAIDIERTFNNPSQITTEYLQTAIDDARRYLISKPNSTKKQERLESLDKKQNVIDQMNERIEEMGRKDLFIGAIQALRGTNRLINVVLGSSL